MREPLWRARPAQCSRRVWALMLALDALPWPLGEDLLARLFRTVASARPSRRRHALEWAAEQPGREPRRLAADLCEFRGRWVAQAGLLGVRRPDDVRPRLTLVGEERLQAAGASILLGFHLGPPNTDVMLRVLGHRLAWVGGRRVSRAWRRPAWRPYLDANEDLSHDGATDAWPPLLYRARRILADGGRVFVKADGTVGRQAFRVPLHGGPMSIRSGWLALHQATGAPVVPVLSHLEGRRHVIEIHPALPPAPTPEDELATWRESLRSLLQDFVSRFPGQCIGPVFLEPRPSALARPVPAGKARRPVTV